MSRVERVSWVELVQRVDDAGFDMLVTADHLGGCLAPLLPLATSAEVSGRLRFVPDVEEHGGGSENGVLWRTHRS